ncbi:MAG: hypothetical protein ACE5J5_06280, partial [Candidatus Hydrothermarchaeales archaeon]
QEGVQQQSAVLEHVIQINDQDSGKTVAYIGFIRASCVAGGGTSLYYGINSGHGVDYREDFAWGTFDDRFHKFTFKVNQDGTSKWMRNDINKLSSSNEIPTNTGWGANLELRLIGTGHDIYFDDIQVVK